MKATKIGALCLLLSAPATSQAALLAYWNFSQFNSSTLTVSDTIPANVGSGSLITSGFLGPKNGENGGNTLNALFGAARGVEVHMVTDIMQRMWEKLVHLATAAAMTCLMRANVGEIVRTADGEKLFLDLMEAGVDLAAPGAEGLGELVPGADLAVDAEPLPGARDADAGGQGQAGRAAA